MKHLLIKRLKEVQEMLLTNVNGDWDENDPSEEFQAIADIVKGYIPTQRDHMIDELGQLISDDDVADALDRLEAQSEIDGSVDAWDVVSIWQPFENDGWTVDDLLGKL
jgi:hypothetical protein